MAKISKFEKIFSDNFFLLKKHVSHIFTLTKAEKTQKNFSTPFFKNFYKFWSPIGQKFQNLKKFFPTTFFTQKTCFTHFYID